jgi:hypothetical protein
MQYNIENYILKTLKKSKLIILTFFTYDRFAIIKKRKFKIKFNIYKNGI